VGEAVRALSRQSDSYQRPLRFDAFVRGASREGRSNLREAFPGGRMTNFFMWLTHTPEGGVTLFF
jgi:hypothetical protein